MTLGLWLFGILNCLCVLGVGGFLILLAISGKGSQPS